MLNTGFSYWGVAISAWHRKVKITKIILSSRDSELCQEIFETKQEIKSKSEAADSTGSCECGDDTEPHYVTVVSRRHSRIRRSWVYVVFER